MKILLVKAMHFDNLNLSLVYPLGLMYLASYLRVKRNSRDEINIIDLRCCRDRPMDSLKNKIREFCPDIVGISCLTIEGQEMENIAKEIKCFDESCTVVVGGPHATAYSKEILAIPEVDFVIQGEGEKKFCELVTALEDNLSFNEIPSLWYRKKDNIVCTEKPLEPIDINSIPFPAWDLIDLQPYTRRKSMSSLGPRLYMCLFTSRGCPFQCIYCHNIFGKKFRARNSESILKEMQILYDKYQINDFEIIDDCFNFNRARAVDFFQGIIDKQMKVYISFPNGLRVDLLDGELIDLMKRAGVHWVAIGIETGSLQLQSRIGKNIDLAKASSIIEILIKNKIFVAGFFMLGFPTETEVEIKETIAFAANSRLCQAIFSIVTPFEKIKLFEMLDPEHLSRYKAKELNIKNSEFNYFNMNLSNVSDFRLWWLYKYAFIRFYFSLRRIKYFWWYHPRKSFSNFIFFAKVVMRHILDFKILLR